MASPSMKLEMGRRGRLQFTAKELRVIIALAITLISSGFGYVIRCETKFATLTTQLEECKRLQKPSPAPSVEAER